MPSHILEVCNVSKSFGGLASLVEVNFTIDHNEIYAIIGPNGAGKTTLFNCISGFYRPDKGSIIFKGEGITGLSPFNIAKLGIYRTFQNIGLFKNATVLENMLIAQHLNIKSGLLRGALFSKRTKEEEAQAVKNAVVQLEILDICGLKKEKISNLSFGNQRLVELARALIQRPKLLLLDEPASGLNFKEKENFRKLINKVRKDINLTIVIVEHDMRLIMELSDKICVLNYGIKIVEGVPDEIKNNKEVIRIYLGEESTYA